jgi:hypothetical protein
VTQPMQQTREQEQQRVMMEDFHDSARCAGEASAAVSVEAEARGDRRGGRLIGLDNSTGTDWRAVVSSGSATPQAATRGGPSRRAQVLP